MDGIDPRAVFDVLRDGAGYADWVVGTRMIRRVEAGWPQPGTAIHYTVGYGPLRKDDRTESIAYRPDEILELEAKAWPAGTVRIVLRAQRSGGGTLVRIEEEPNKGLAKTLHNPVFDLAIKIRNIETLKRLERLTRQRLDGARPTN
jgi:hypothetical protein